MTAVANGMEHALQVYAREPTFDKYDPTCAMIVGVLDAKTGEAHQADWLRGIALAAQLRLQRRADTLALQREAATPA